MEPKMSGKRESIYRMTLERGQSRRVRGREAKARIDRELHGQVVALGDVKGRVPAAHADWFYDLRRKQNRVYGGLLRFIDDSVELGTPKHIVDAIPDLLRSYIADAYDDTRGRAA